MRILVLGARAPVSLEWLRALHQAGHQVWLADSLWFPLSRISRYAKDYYRLPPARQQPLAWAARIREIVQGLAIDLCIPTCEEVFYLAWLQPSLPRSCQAFCPDLSTLDALHNKARLAESSQQWPIRTPESHLLTKPEQLAGVAEESHQWVFKPVYSRFANHTLIAPAPSQLAMLAPSEHEPWLAQRLVHGIEYCSQSLFIQGRLVGHCLYQPRHRAGRGAGIYFAPAESVEVREFIRGLGAKLEFNGQLGIDFVQDQQGKWWLLEANPRATSGLHLLPGLARLFGPRPMNDRIRAGTSPAMLALAMLVYGGRARGTASFWRDFFKARDVVWCWRDPWPTLTQPLSLLELLLAAWHHRSDLLSQTTRDIAWNGETLPSLPAVWRA